ncbi:MAG: hypothetical protein RSA01_02600 [Clostridium sp.]|uniref:hypothetical protein n=1 Tax=Clostridium sp. TaxID=1506 RepID=UPI002FC9C515
MNSLNLGPIFKLVCNVCESANCVLEVKQIEKEGLEEGQIALRISSLCMMCMAKEDKEVIISVK